MQLSFVGQTEKLGEKKKGRKKRRVEFRPMSLNLQAGELLATTRFQRYYWSSARWRS
jgi:hypothetical protein